MCQSRQMAILYSGGTDSTCAAAVAAEKFDTIHLLTYKRFGIFNSTRSERNYQKLKDKFVSVNFIHKIISIDKLYAHISYHDYFRDSLRYGLYMASNCAFCGLVNHFRTLIYCLDNNINDVADGATREWLFFPSHMEKAISEVKNMYARFNITYSNPVFNFSVWENMNYLDKMNMDKQNRRKIFLEEKLTTGEYLSRIGIFSSDDIKGTDLDHKIQARCFQFILTNIFVYWYYLQKHDYTDYEQLTVKFYKNKIDYFLGLVREYQEKGCQGRLFRFK